MRVRAREREVVCACGARSPLRPKLQIARSRRFFRIQKYVDTCARYVRARGGGATHTTLFFLTSHNRSNSSVFIRRLCGGVGDVVLGQGQTDATAVSASFENNPIGRRESLHQRSDTEVRRGSTNGLHQGDVLSENVRVNELPRESETQHVDICRAQGNTKI